MKITANVMISQSIDKMQNSFSRAVRPQSKVVLIKLEQDHPVLASICGLWPNCEAQIALHLPSVRAVAW